MMIKPQYWFWESEIPVSVCENIIHEGLKLPSVEAVVGDEEKQKLDPNIRQSVVGFFSSGSWLGGITQHYLDKANKQAWNFDINGQQDIQFTKYDKNQFYEWHEDSSLYDDGMRKLSLVISLTNPDHYEGGDFEFNDGKVDLFKSQGSIIVFPSFLMHRVTPVVQGTRYSLVSWFAGPMFK